MDFRNYRELALTAEPGWGIAFIRGQDYEVYHQTLYWLLNKGVTCSLYDLNVTMLAGCNIISYRINIRALERLLRENNIIYYKSHEECRWVLPEPISQISYIHWNASILLHSATQR